jgi:hypothetical protein
MTHMISFNDALKTVLKACLLGRLLVLRRLQVKIHDKFKGSFWNYNSTPKAVFQCMQRN